MREKSNQRREKKEFETLNTESSFRTAEAIPELWDYKQLKAEAESSVERN